MDLACAHCGNEFTARRERLFCGIQCSTANLRSITGKPYVPAWSRSQSNRSRENHMAAAYEENVVKEKVFQRDNYTCYLCGQACDKLDGWPSPRYPTLDHYVPISRGGKHNYQNCLTACWSCNKAKRNTLPGVNLSMPAEEDVAESYWDSGDLDDDP